jgi:predicted dehydrogenase/threonine dehydrogenase-like Zn-dependent dehydrogenase
MKTLLRNLESGELSLQEVPAPRLEAHGVVVRNHYSLISAGTERAQVAMDRRSLLGKARARPDLVRQVLRKIRSDGLVNTYRAVRNRLTTPVPLGYSCAGEVLEAGEMVENIRAGDLVACSGGGYANHSEVVYVPRNLAAAVPGDLEPRVAATAGVGAIALQGVRQAGVRLGETAAVIGLGLIGQMTCQLLSAAGCKVVGIDIDERALEFAASHTPDCVYLGFDPDRIAATVADLTGGLGVDATIICAATKSSEPIELSAEITREQGTVSVVGLVNLDVPREAFYRKELKLALSRSLGPGRYDPLYEEHGIDYPAAHVRWTEGRNMAAWLQLASEKKIDPGALITHEFEFDRAPSAYDMITGKSEYYLGVLLRYDAGKSHLRGESIPIAVADQHGKDSPAVGVIGAGSYASKFILPYLKGVSRRGVAGASGISAASAAKRFGFSFTGDAEAVIEDEATDTVIIATRHDSHAQFVVAALAANKAVFVEKPLCLTIGELRRIIASAGDSAFLHVGFNRRFAPAVGLVRKHMQGCGALTVASRINAGPLSGHWLQDTAVGGGRIIGEGCHFIDLARHLAGSPISRVFAAGVRKAGSTAIGCEDVTFSLEFENGSVAAIVYTGSGSKAQTKERHELYAGGRSAVIDDYRAVELYCAKRSRRSLRPRDTGQAEQMRRFIEARKSGKPLIPFAEIVEVTLATLAVVESLTRSAPVSMAEMHELLENAV